MIIACLDQGSHKLANLLVPGSITMRVHFPLVFPSARGTEQWE
jgi:hypothetical protein